MTAVETSDDHEEAVFDPDQPRDMSRWVDTGVDAGVDARCD
jgi:hypothetical protein